MSHSQQPPASTILLIEADPSLQRLITLGLQHHGHHVITATSLATLPPLSNQPIDLLLLDIDHNMHSNWSLLATVQSHPHLSTLPTIILSWECSPLIPTPLPAITSSTQHTLPTALQPTTLPKPFDARALHTAIDQLLTARLAQQAGNEARLEALLLARHTTHTTPSIWPLITAAGLLLAFIGMLFHIVITILGLLILILGLLLWTLGTRPQPSPTVLISKS